MSFHLIAHARDDGGLTMLRVLKDTEATEDEARAEARRHARWWAVIHLYLSAEPDVFGNYHAIEAEVFTKRGERV